MNIHVQKLVKVNAKVDKGIASLVEALNDYPGIFTTSSCEGRKHQDAYVAFDMDGDAFKLVAFVNALSVALGSNDHAHDFPFALSLEWYAGGETPNGYLRVPRQHTHTLADAIRSVKADVVAIVRQPRKSRCADDRECRESHNYPGYRRRQRLPPSGDAHANCHA